MEVLLLHKTPLWVCAKAIRKCWDSEDKSDTIFFSCDYEYDYSKTILGSKDLELIHRVGNKYKHKSVLEHIHMTFEIYGISRLCLQELARHRMQNLSVQSTRYTLSKELKKEEPFDEDSFARASKYINFTEDKEVNSSAINSLEILRLLAKSGVSNDKLKYALPECWKVNLVSTMDLRNFQSFYKLRSSKDAHPEIKELAEAMFNSLPKEYQDLVREEND